MTAISWADATWNPVVGCSKVSAGCANCYAIGEAWRLAHNPCAKVSGPYRGLVAKGGGRLNWTGELRFLEGRLLQPRATRRPSVIFVNSMSDLFHERLPFEIVDQVFAVMRLAPEHCYVILTKRPAIAGDYLRSRRLRPGLLGTATRALAERFGVDLEVGATTQGLARHWALLVSIEDPASAAERLPLLRKIAAPIRGVSAEPLLAKVELGAAVEWLQWAIVGGERARPVSRARRMPAEAPFALKWECERAGVPFWFKQWGSAWGLAKRDDELLQGRRWFDAPPEVLTRIRIDEEIST